MRYLIIIITLLLLHQTALSQTPSLVGTWSFANDSSVISYYFKNDGGCFIHKGLKDGVILPENLKKGTYIVNDNLLLIKWADNSVEERKFVFINTNTLQLSGQKKSSANNKTMRLKRQTFASVSEVKPINND